MKREKKKGTKPKSTDGRERRQKSLLVFFIEGKDESRLRWWFMFLLRLLFFLTKGYTMINVASNWKREQRIQTMVPSLVVLEV